MNKPKHTPGPADLVAYVMETEYDDYVDNEGPTGHVYELARDNARLISAAPEMFELLLDVACSKSHFAEYAQTLVRRIKGESHE